MRFEKLKLAGFKSFVEPAELRIDPGLTGIVGPNGCGKSNLLEALRWVMGESSPKSLRGGGMEDVIFAGTSTRPMRSFAEVVLSARGNLASNDDRESEIEVARRIERGAGSAYRLNGREVRAKDVALVFADAATGAHSPALVSQGRIAAVIAARPTERRAMLEEAAGIAGLHVRRRDAEGKLRATEANLARLDELLAGLAARIVGLRRQARAAERYRALSDQIKVADAKLVFARWREAAEDAEAARREAAKAEALVSEAQQAAKEAQQLQHDAASALAAGRGELAACREKAQAHGHRLAALTGKLEAAEQRLSDLDRQMARLAVDHGEAGQITGSAATALGGLRSGLAEAEQALTGAQARRPALVEVREQAEGIARACELALAQAQAAQAGSEAEWRVAEAAIASARNALTRNQAERARREQQAVAIAADGATQDAVAQAQAAVEVARGASAEAQTRRDHLAADRTRLVEARDTTADALARARAELAGLEREAAVLRREQAARRGQGGGLTAISQVRAAPGYERALGAVLGRDGGAPLGEPQTGATGRYWAGAPVPPPLEASLSEHVPVAPPELSARLARVRFVESDDGHPLAPGEWLVTRDGDLRRWDGFLVRGEGVGEAASLEAANRLTALDFELPAAQAARERGEAAAAAASTGLAEAQKALAAAEQALARAAAAERTALRTLDQAETARERHAARTSEIAAALAEVAAQEAQLTSELEEAEQRHAALPDPAAGRHQLEQAKAAHEQARREVQAATAELTSLDQAAAGLRERRATACAEIRSWEARAGDAEKRIAEFARRQDELSSERAVLAAIPAGLQHDLNEGEALRLSLAAELAVAEAKARQCEATAHAADRRLAAVAEALATAREARAGAVARAESQDSRRAEAARLAGERFACPPPLLPGRFGFSPDAIGEPGAEAMAMDRLLAERERLGAVNLVAADELTAAEAEHGQTAAEQAELTEAVHRLRGSIGNLNREGRERLRAAFAAVDGHFRRLFARLFNGGGAHLAMIDSDDPLEAGLEIYAQPPGKRLQSLTLLSGGEQALTAVALIFALFLTKPSPICVLDEVDAPLDDANVERFCDLLDAMVDETETRYLIVTHNAVTMSRMHRLFGVTMVEQGVSRLVSVDLGSAEELLAAE